MNSVISFSNVEKSFGSKIVLENLNLVIPKGMELRLWQPYSPVTHGVVRRWSSLSFQFHSGIRKLLKLKTHLRVNSQGIDLRGIVFTNGIGLKLFLL